MYKSYKSTGGIVGSVVVNGLDHSCAKHRVIVECSDVDQVYTIKFKSIGGERFIKCSNIGEVTNDTSFIVDVSGVVELQVLSLVDTSDDPEEGEDRVPVWEAGDKPFRVVVISEK